MSRAEGCCTTDSTTSKTQVTERTQTEMSPSALAKIRAEGRIREREEIRAALKALPQDCLFYPANILKLLKLD